jgi:DNA invertase Pin-like site-specific DNA recombinase
LARQEDALLAAGVSKIFSDKLSGAKVDRPGLNELLEHAREGDTITVVSLDRLGRSTLHVLETMKDLHKRGIVLKSLKENIDFSTTAGQFMAVIFAGMAAMQRSLINERAAEARASAIARGKAVGRPKAMTPAQVDTAASLKASGTNMSEIARRLGVSRATLYRADIGA